MKGILCLAALSILSGARAGPLPESPPTLGPAPRLSRYALKDHLQLSVHSSRLLLDRRASQRLQLAASLKVDHSDVLAEARLPLDLVLCLDTSSLVGPQTLQALQKVIRASVGHMRAHDRVSLISFSDAVRVHSELVPMTDEGKKAVLGALDSLSLGGGPGPMAAVQAAYRALTDRKFKNEHSAIVLVVGGGEGAKVEFSELQKSAETFDMYMKNLGESYSVNVVETGGSGGAGLDALASISGGSYNFVGRSESLPEVWAELSGRLLSAVATNVYISFFSNEKMDFISDASEGWLDPSIPFAHRTIHDLSLRTEVFKKIAMVKVGAVHAGLDRDWLIDVKVNLTEEELNKLNEYFYLGDATLSLKHKGEDFELYTPIVRFFKGENAEDKEVGQAAARFEAARRLRDARKRLMSGDAQSAAGVISACREKLPGGKVAEIVDPGLAADLTRLEEAVFVLERKQFSAWSPHFAPAPRAGTVRYAMLKEFFPGLYK